MTYPGNAGDRRAHSGRELLPHHLHNTAYNKHYSRQIQADVIDKQHPACFCPGEGKALFQQKQQQEHHHTQQEVMCMDYR